MHCSKLASRRLPPQVGLLDALLLHWLVAGIGILMLAPAWQHVWLGWLPYWLVLVPGALLGWRWVMARYRRTHAAPAWVTQRENGNPPRCTRLGWTGRRVILASPAHSRHRRKFRREGTAVGASLSGPLLPGK